MKGNVDGWIDGAEGVGIASDGVEDDESWYQWACYREMQIDPEHI